ncbi:MAG: hypothetical protein ACRDL5_13920 [Solirubrobacteraceae bacterium]
MALGALLIVIVLIAVGVHSCAVSAGNSALQSYTSQATSLIQQSNANGAALFKALSNATASGAPTTQTAVDSASSEAGKLWGQVRGLSVPGQLTSANTKLAFAFQMRADGMNQIASQIGPAMGGTSSAPGAVEAIALQLAQFYASDVVYKDYAAPEIYSAMHRAGVRFAGLPAGQFLPSLDWLAPSTVAQALHVTLPVSVSGSSPTPCTASACGHQLNSVSVSGTQLSPGSTNTVASTRPTFVLNFTNSGKQTETDVVCKVSINGTSIAGSKTVAQTHAGHTYPCSVRLSSAAPQGTQNVTAEIMPVPGEKNTSNNTATYPVTFP